MSEEKSSTGLSAAEATADVVKSSLDLTAHLTIKELFVPALLIGIGAALLAIRDVLYELTTWTNTELVVLVVAWDAWVTYQDFVDIESNLIIAGLEVLSDALRFLGISFLPKFSVDQIFKSLIGPIISPEQVRSSLEEVATCENVSSGPEILGLSLKMGLNDSICPTIRYFEPTSIGWFFKLFDFATFGVDNNCECDPNRYTCNRLPLCLVLNSGYLFIDLLFPLFVIGLLLYFLLLPILRMAFDTTKGVLELVADILSSVASSVYESF